MSDIVLWFIALPLYGLAMYLSGKNDGYYKALKERNKEVKEVTNENR